MISESTDHWARFDRKKAARHDPGSYQNAGFLLGLIWKIAIPLAVVASLAYGLRAGIDRPDPHFVKARTMIEDYELVRSPEARDYGHPVYGHALAELDQVSPRSVSAEAATLMAEDLRTKVTEFSERRRAMINAREQAEKKRKRKSSAVLAEREYRKHRPPEGSH